MNVNPAIPMKAEIDVQVATVFSPLPAESELCLWAQTALRDLTEADLTLRLVDSEESHKLNSRFRGKSQPTNVLSFPAELPPGLDIPLLGDVVICAPLVNEEAAVQGKSLQAHFAHLVIHGVLHLQGYDHQDDQQAAEMEALEVELLNSLGFANPYT
jgi:probable rRNA maturation factor